MSAAPVLLEERRVEEQVETASSVSAPVEKKQDYELLIILTIVIAIAFTFTASVIGSILIGLSLRGTGVMG